MTCLFCGHEHIPAKRGLYKSNVKYRCGRICRECKTAYQREYSKRNRKRYNESTRAWALRLKLEAIAAYGGCCQCCGITDHRFLTLEHLENDGAQHRRRLNTRDSSKIIADIKKQGWPQQYTILCFNCNCAKFHNGGICPHQEISSQRTALAGSAP